VGQRLRQGRNEQVPAGNPMKFGYFTLSEDKMALFMSEVAPTFA
jgi:hypothetical protein